MASIVHESQVPQENDSALEAVKIWERGVSKEKDGSMMDAIKFYREALRVNEDVEKVYRRKIHAELQLSKKLEGMKLSGGNEVHTDFEEDKGTTVNQDIEPCWILEKLPNDLLLHIVREVALMSGESWVNLSLTCSAFNKMCFHNSTPFKAFAKYIYPLQHYDETSMALNQISSTELIGELFWQDDYFKMINERPYIKFQGIYISVVNYLRHGANPEGSSSLIIPIHMITYYRYFRFYPDGTCLRLLTTNEPSDVVPSYDKSRHIKGAAICHWFLSLDDNFGRISISRHDEKYQFLEELQIESQGSKKHHRLTWINSSATDKEGNKADFSLRNEKPFFFSRVKSYYQGKESVPER